MYHSQTQKTNKIVEEAQFENEMKASLGRPSGNALAINMRFNNPTLIRASLQHKGKPGIA